MTKKLMVLAIGVLLAFAAFVFSGCEDVDKGLKVGFEVSTNGNPSPSDYCAYKSDISEFDINNVTLEFFYGGIFSESIENERSHGRNIGNVKLYFYNPALGEFDINVFSDENQYFIKESEENYTSEAHRWKGNLYKDGEGETLTIPKELFVGEKGLIGFMIFGKDENHRDYPNNEYEYVSGKNIYYKVNGDRVVLSGEPIK